MDTQSSGQPLSPEVAIGKMQFPDGFKVTLAAAEPDVRQPIAISYDDRGRLWVAESYSYDGSDFTDKKEDRILIFDDKDGDGVFESQKIFCSDLNRLTGLVWGFGGIWVTAPPYLLFIPDADGDDKPDGYPIVQLDGWTLKAEHNSVNGLAWGPDGWLYGRHGEKEPSHPGRPGTPVAVRPAIAAGIWRYHPVTHVFETVADGAVNPWGLDWDELGQMFMSTSVMDHLWHIVPGSHLRRPTDVAVQAHVYELMDSITDHSHRPTRGAKNSAPLTNDGGGGHSHVDAMIYLGDRWPDEYRGKIFLNNVMGRRVNQERILRNPVTGRFIASHNPDFLRANDPWFKGVSLEYGPDGDVVLTDWSDQGECHDRDGVSRSTGRIYKISWGQPHRVSVMLSKASNEDLVAMQIHRNEWFVRHARRLLQERAQAGGDFGMVHRRLREMFTSEPQAAGKLRALWALYVTGGANRNWLESQLSHPEESVRYWVVRLLVDTPESAHAAGPRLAECARTETTWLVRMALASALPTVEPVDQWEMGSALAASMRDEDDVNLARLVWAGWHVAVAANPEKSLALALRLPVSNLRQWIARRLGEDVAAKPELITSLIQAIGRAGHSDTAADLTVGVLAGLDSHVIPEDSSLLQPLRNSYDALDSAAGRSALLLGAKFGDPAAIERLRAQLDDETRPEAWRLQILRALVGSKVEWLPQQLLGLIAHGRLVEPSIRALAAWDDPAVAPALLSGYSKFAKRAKAAAIDTLLARPDSAHKLLDAVVAGKVAKSDISSFQARQLANSTDLTLRARAEETLGRMNSSSAAIAARQKKLKYILKDKVYMDMADVAQGRTMFTQRCAVCHTLFGQGGKVGPDLTGSGRKDLDYLLINILDPNASIPADFRLVMATLNDGRVIAGSVSADHENSFVLQTLAGSVSIDKSALKSLERMDTSLMPTGLLDDLTVDQVRDLFGFLMSDDGPETNL